MKNKFTGDRKIKDRNALVLSIHDVAPSTQEVVQVMIAELKELGVSTCSLLVIPYYHNKESLTTAPQFMKWLHERQQEGHEIVLHGCSHLRPMQSQESRWTKWMTQSYTRGEGEFYDLNYDEALAKIRMGKKEFERAGFSTECMAGFIAPAWLLSQEAEQALRDEGFIYTTRLHGVVNLRTRSSRSFYHSQSMVYSVSSGWRRQISLLWNEFLLQLSVLQAWPLLRLGLHPPDWKHAAIRSHVLASVRKVIKQRQSLTYSLWIERNDNLFSTQKNEPLVKNRK